MLDLKQMAERSSARTVTEKDRRIFGKADFDPGELKQLKEMDEHQLAGLMIYCGIRVFNGVPLVVMTEDEMRMAYVIWRSERLKERSKKWQVYVERGMKWSDYIKRAVELAANR